MPLFKVELQRRNRSYDANPYRNPFLMRIEHLPPTMFAVRAWEFEADDEAHVRRLLHDAREQDVDAVRGFELCSIQRIDPPPSEE